MKLNRKTSFGVGAVLFGLFLLITIFGSEGLIRLHDLYKMRDQVIQENQVLNLARQDLQRELALLKEPLYLQQMVRQKLGYLKSNEYLLLLDDSHSLPVLRAETQRGRQPAEVLDSSITN